MSFQDILQWWNIIYAAPLVVSLVWIAMTVLSGAHGVGSHGHVHAGHGADSRYRPRDQPCGA